MRASRAATGLLLGVRAAICAGQLVLVANTLSLRFATGTPRLFVAPLFSLDSLAMRLAAVSLAKRGKLSVARDGLFGVAGGIGVVILSRELKRLGSICVRSEDGGGRELGGLTKRCSFVADVGRSSKSSSSVPSPKLRRREGRVTVRLAAASRARVAGATSRRADLVGVSGGARDMELGRGTGDEALLGSEP